MEHSIYSSIILALSGLAITIYYSRHTLKLSRDKMTKELFTEFNLRYDKIKDQLTLIAKLTDEQIEALSEAEFLEYRKSIIEFFNICAEEYYWKTEKRINPKIWRSWHKGMNAIFEQSELIQKIWIEECQNGGFQSYYITSSTDFFIKA